MFGGNNLSRKIYWRRFGQYFLLTMKFSTKRTIQKFHYIWISLYKKAKRTHVLKILSKIRRIVWNKVPAWGKMRRWLKSQFSRNFSKKSHFWHVIKSQKNFLVKSRQWGSKTKVLTYFLEVLYSVISPRDQIVVNFQFTIFDH